LTTLLRTNSKGDFFDLFHLYLLFFYFHDTLQKRVCS